MLEYLRGYQIEGSKTCQSDTRGPLSIPDLDRAGNVDSVNRGERLNCKKYARGKMKEPQEDREYVNLDIRAFAGALRSVDA
jgi:hypothetical protein